MPGSGPLALTGSTSAANDTNAVNNTAAAVIAPTAGGGLGVLPVPTLSAWMQALLLALLVLVGVLATRRRMRNDA